jgi:hypothetical protein
MYTCCVEMIIRIYGQTHEIVLIDVYMVPSILMIRNIRNDRYKSSHMYQGQTEGHNEIIIRVCVYHGQTHEIVFIVEYVVPDPYHTKYSKWRI